MSIVTVHGPYTMYSKAVVQNASGSVSAAATNPANGLIWTFTPRDLSQVAANYDWAYTGLTGTPATPIADTKSPTITFSGAGTAVVTLTLNGVAQPPITVTAVAGVAPREMLMGEEGDGEPESRSAPESPEVPIAFDPAAHTVAEVEEYAEEHPDQAQELLDAEAAGKNRTTLVAFLEGLMPYDPGDHSVTEVIGYIEDNPDQLDTVMQAEQAGKARVTLLQHLESMRPES